MESACRQPETKADKWHQCKVKVFPFPKLLGVAFLRHKRRAGEALEPAKPEESIRQDGWGVLGPSQQKPHARKEQERIPDLDTSRAGQQQGLKQQKRTGGT